MKRKRDVTVLEENLKDKIEPEQWNEIAIIPFSIFIAVDDFVIIASMTSDDSIVDEVLHRKGAMETDEKSHKDEDSETHTRQPGSLKIFSEVEGNIGEEVFKYIGRLRGNVREITMPSRDAEKQYILFL